MKLLLSLLLSVASLASQAAYVDSVTGRTWMEVANTQGMSWDFASTLCNPTTGVCSQPVAGVSGLHWASIDDVRGLFQNMSIPIPAGGNGATTLNSLWAPAAIDRDGAGPDSGYFLATFVAGDFSMVGGLTRDLFGDLVSRPSIQDFGFQGSLDFALLLNDQTSKFDPHPRFGLWLYSEAAAQVPEPMSASLVLPGLLAIAAISRRKRQRKG